MTLKGIGDVTLFAPDLEAYWAWLETALGAVLQQRYPHLIQGQIGTVSVTVHPADEKSPTGPGGQVVYWAVDDVNEAMQHLARHGARPYRGPVVGEEGARVAQLQDPWGNIWGLIEGTKARGR
ncbi:MAG: VOC family protein [Firmicutes bacterium]|nr:VOC family protein [Bacillota bacterium]